MIKKLPLKIILLFGLAFLICFLVWRSPLKSITKIIPTPSTALRTTPSPTPTPTPKPLTFAEMNALYGPCVFLPTLIYHHVQDAETAKSKNQTGLTVTPETFAKQMQYLKDKGYNTVTLQDLVNFFDNGAPIAKKSILLTFDDAYDDFAQNAYPILAGLEFKATVFVPTGLINNYGYLSWDQVKQIASEGRVFFANHTWSHKNVAVAGDVMQKEISTADTQLSERGLNNPKVFAYPYGLDTSRAEKYLTELGYKLAFGTKSGSIACVKQRLNLPRLRIGNVPLTFYGF